MTAPPNFPLKMTGTLQIETILHCRTHKPMDPEARLGRINKFRAKKVGLRMLVPLCVESEEDADYRGVYLLRRLQSHVSDLKARTQTRPHFFYQLAQVHSQYTSGACKRFVYEGVVSHAPMMVNHLNVHQPLPSPSKQNNLRTDSLQRFAMDGRRHGSLVSMCSCHFRATDNDRTNSGNPWDRHALAPERCRAHRTPQYHLSYASPPVSKGDRAFCLWQCRFFP